MYADNYARFRAAPTGAPPPPPPPPPRGAPVRFDALDMAPEELAKSLQPVAGAAAWYKRRAAPPRGYDALHAATTTTNGYPPATSAAYAASRQPANGFLPPVKYRRAGDAGELDGGNGASASRGANAYELDPRGMAQPSMLRGGAGGGYAPYAPPSPATPRAQQELLLRRRQLEPERFDAAAMSATTYRGASPLSSAAAAWARELDPYDHARRIHRELQPVALPPSSASSNGNGNGNGNGAMTPQASAQMHLRGAPSGFANSPGSRIVTPAAALHNAPRSGGGGGMMGARRMSPARNGQHGHGSGMRASLDAASELGYDQLEPVPMGSTVPNGAMPRARMAPPTSSAASRGNGLALPPTAAAQMSPQEYNAMLMMERELSMAPDERRGAPRPRANHHRQGISPARGPVETKFDVDPYTIQPTDEYERPAPPSVELPMRKAPKQQAKAPAAREAPAPKKRKESAAAKRKREEADDDDDAASPQNSKQAASKAGAAAAPGTEPKRRCGRKSMNYSSEQKRERNRAAVKKCRQRQALKYEYLKRKAEVLASENRALSEMLVKNVELDDEKRNSLTRGIQMDILLKIKEIFTQSLPKDFVLDADSIWDLNSVLAVSMPSRCYYGIESIKDFWRTSLRMRNKGKIRSFWAWLFRLPPGDRFAEFKIEPFSSTSNLYFINWTTKSTPALSGSIVIMFGHGHRVTLHVEIFGWLIWRYLLTNTPFPEPPLE